MCCYREPCALNICAPSQSWPRAFYRRPHHPIPAALGLAIELHLCAESQNKRLRSDLKSYPLPHKITSVDAHLGDGLFLLASLIHAQMRESALCNTESGNSLRFYQTRRGAPGSSLAFAPNGLAGNKFFEFCARINAVGLRPNGQFPAAANLRGAYLHGANLSGADLKGADLSEADLSEADLGGADLREANFSGAYLRRAGINGTDLRQANLNGANLEDADLRGAGLRKANLTGANLNGANLSGAQLSGANLSNAQLIRAQLRGAQLRGALLSHVDLRGAHLSGAYLRWSNLKDTLYRPEQLRHAIFDEDVESSDPDAS